MAGRTRDVRIRRFAAAAFAGLAGLLIATAAVSPVLASGQPAMAWQFRVLLDGEEIGYHRFELERGETFYRMKSEADFRVRFLFFDAYRYRHVNEELWEEDCLQQIDARTEVNGKSVAVKGQQGDAGFVVATDAASQVLGECVMTFAYWNPEFLDQKRLLNSQTGEYVPVAIEPVSEERLEIRGRPVDAIRYSLDAGQLDMQLWYTPEREWLALESTVRGGRLLRYELR
jgi:hypothetical protein